MRLIFLLLLYSAQTFAAVDNFTTHVAMASNNKLGMNIRWNALIKAADFAGAEHLVQIRNFTLNKDWYMRNAAMIALLKINPVEAMIEAKKLLRDKALVVRSAAVDVMGRNLTSEHKKILAEELNKTYNFHKKNSLWIRKQIIEKLASSANSEDRHVFVKNLFDSDKEISHISAKTLEKITGQYVGDVKFVEKWKALVKQNNWL